MGQTPVPDLLAAWLAAAGGDIASAKQACGSERPRVEQLRDPFMAVVRGDEEALAKETILWRNDKALVLVDAFAGSPKALVIPVEELLFPLDGDGELLAYLAQVAATVADAFADASGTKTESKIWINPPASLTVRQLHVHVQPRLARGDTQANAALFSRVCSYLEANL